MQQGDEVITDFRVHGGHFSLEDFASRSVDGDEVSFLDANAPDRRLLAFRSICISSHPETQGFPIPLATTAAWEVFPPRLVRIPWEAKNP